jgi:hypothetical protein
MRSSQGYLMAVPMPAAEAFSLIKSLLEVPRLRGPTAAVAAQA